MQIKKLHFRRQFQIFVQRYYDLWTLQYGCSWKNSFVEKICLYFINFSFFFVLITFSFHLHYRYWKDKLTEDTVGSISWFAVLLLPSLGGIVNAMTFLVVNRVFIKPSVRIKCNNVVDVTWRFPFHRGEWKSISIYDYYVLA